MSDSDRCLYPEIEAKRDAPVNTKIGKRRFLDNIRAKSLMIITRGGGYGGTRHRGG